MKTRVRLNLLTTEVLKFAWDYKAVWHKVEMFEALEHNTRSVTVHFLVVKLI